jgi:polar amino acid transport system substrate-binding protein
MVDGARRNLLTAGLGIAAGATLIGSARAEDAPASESTWDRILRTKVLRAGAALQEPWYFKDTAGTDAPGAVKSGSDVWRGVAPVIAAEIAKAMGVELQIVETAWGNAAAGLQSGQYDFMLCLDGNPTRALAIDFAPVPFLWYPMAVLLRPEVKIASWAEANDAKYRWGVTLGSSSDLNLTRRAPNGQITRFQEVNEMYAAFQSGRVDGIFSLGPSLDLVRQKLGAGNLTVLAPAAALAAGVALRAEPDQRFKSYMTTAISYYYNVGQTQAAYEQFLSFRGNDPSKALPIIK